MRERQSNIGKYVFIPPISQAELDVREGGLKVLDTNDRMTLVKAEMPIRLPLLKKQFQGWEIKLTAASDLPKPQRPQK